VDLTGGLNRAVLTGYTAGTQPANAPGAADLGEAGRTATLGTGVEANIFELFNTGNYDLRFEGSDARLSTPSTQTDLNREFLGFAGETCQSVGLNATTTSVSASPNPALVSSPVTLTATVNKGTGVPIPTGTVTFTDGASVLGTGSVNASSMATLQTSVLALGTHTITASYGGDSVYGASASATIIVKVVTVLPDFTITIPNANATVVAGQSANFTISIASQGGFNGAVNFSCSGLPQASSCVFSPPSLTAGGSAVSSALTISTTAHTIASAFPMPGIVPGALAGVGLLGLVVVGGVTGRRRMWQSASMLLIVLAIATTMAGCGGGGRTPTPNPTTGTPAGTYSVTVTGASGSTSHAGTITLVVQ